MKNTYLRISQKEYETACDAKEDGEMTLRQKQIIAADQNGDILILRERPDYLNQCRYVGGGYGIDRSGSYREAFWGA